MNDHHDLPDDIFEQTARNAGAALRRPAPIDGVTRLNSARRRQRILRSSLAATASAIVIVVGLVVVTRPSDDSVAPSGTSPTSTGAPTTTTTAAPTTTTPAPLSLSFTLTGVEGLGPIGEPSLTHVSSYTTMITAWSAAAGVTDGYLVLSESQLPTAPVPQDGVTTESIDVPDGRALFVTDNVVASVPSATRLMWWRADGRLWTVRSYGLSRDRTSELTLKIQPGSGLPYVLPDPSMTFVGFNTAEAYQSVRQDWTVDEQFLEIGLTTGGLAEQLADEVPVSVVERTIAGRTGYEITRTNGQVKLTWPTGDTDQWAHLGVNEHLVDRIDELVAAITPR